MDQSSNKSDSNDKKTKKLTKTSKEDLGKKMLEILHDVIEQYTSPEEQHIFPEEEKKGKSKLARFSKERDELEKKIINILQLDANNSFTLDELDNNVEKQKKLTELIPDIKKYYSACDWSFIKRPDMKRAYLYIVKNTLTDTSYDFITSSVQVKDGDNKKLTRKYRIIKKQ